MNKTVPKITLKGLYFWKDHIIRWNESVLSFSDMEFITDHILLPLLVRYSPGYLVVCGKQEDIILDYISRIDPEAVKRVGYKPPILKRLVSIDFANDVAMHTLKKLQDGNMTTRLILPADALQAIKCLGGLVKFLNLTSQESKTISFEKLKVNAILSINKPILKQLNIIPGDCATETPSLFALLRAVVCSEAYILPELTFCPDNPAGRFLLTYLARKPFKVMDLVLKVLIS